MNRSGEQICTYCDIKNRERLERNQEGLTYTRK